MGGLLATFVGVCTYAFLFEPHSAPTRLTPAAQPIDPRKNPLDDAAAKWGLAAGLHTINDQQHTLRFKILIVRYQVPYAEHLANDLKEVLKVMDWDYEESFATTQIEPGLSIVLLQGHMPQGRLESLLTTAFNNAATWHDRQWNVPMVNTPMTSEQTERMKNCGECVQLNIGNDPDQ
jgi:hypothetical protein